MRDAVRLAGTRHGVLSASELRELGLPRGRVERELARGTMRRLHRGVYLLGPVLSRAGCELAAVLACSPDAALSHRSAAHRWGLLPSPTDPRPVHVSIAGRNPGGRQGVRVHRVKGLERDKLRIRDAIPITSPARTIVDLAASLDPRGLERAVAEAFALRITSRPDLLAAIDRRPGRRGLAGLRSLLDAEHPPARTRSAAERALLALVRGESLPEPEVNARVGPWTVDFLWRRGRLAVEVDGYAAHSSPRAFERDRVNTAELEDAGLTMYRVSARQLRDRPGAVIEGIIARLR